MSKNNLVFSEDLWITFQSNVYPAMLNCLAEDLGVTVESIKKLGVGFYPLEQAWIFAERDHKGNIIGLQRRYKNGKKFMIEGSKRGLSYEVNSTYKKQKSNCIYSKFIRLRDAGVSCPLCGKDDWCLISADDVNNPSAVICPRIEKGSKRYIERSGYLHQLRELRHSRSDELLSVSNKPYLVVEGSSDVLVAMDMGYVAIGKPAAENGNEFLAKLLKNKNVIVLGENDDSVGVRGMESTFQTLKPKCKSVVKILPPDDFKDLREWKPTADEFEKWVKKNRVTKTADGIFETTHFPLLTDEFLEKFPRLVCFEGDWFDWEN